MLNKMKNTKKSITFIGFTAIFSIILLTMIIISTNSYKQEVKEAKIGEQANEIIKARYFLNSLNYFEEKSFPKIFYKTQQDFIIKKEKEIIEELQNQETYTTHEFKSCVFPQSNLIFWYNSVVDKQSENSKNICFPKILENFEEEFLAALKKELDNTYPKFQYTNINLSSHIEDNTLQITSKKTYKKGEVKITSQENKQQFSIKEYKEKLLNIQNNTSQFIECINNIAVIENFQQEESKCTKEFENQKNVELKPNREGNTKDTLFLLYELKVNFTHFNLKRYILIKQEKIAEGIIDAPIEDIPKEPTILV